MKFTIRDNNPEPTVEFSLSQDSEGRVLLHANGILVASVSPRDGRLWRCYVPTADRLKTGLPITPSGLWDQGGQG